MAIHVTCVCGQQYPVPSEYAGLRVQCQLCGQVLTVPGRPGAALPPASRLAPPDLGPEPWQAPSKAPLVIAILMILLLLGGATTYILLTQPDEPADRPDPGRAAATEKPADPAGDAA